MKGSVFIRAAASIFILLWVAQGEVNAQTTPGPGILFFDFNLTRGTTPAAPIVELTGQRKIPGQLKELPPGPTPEEGLTISLVDSEGAVRAQQFHQNPLDYWAEVPDDNGELRQHRVQVEQAGFFVRFEDDPAAQLVEVWILRAGRSERLLRQHISR